MLQQSLTSVTVLWKGGGGGHWLMSVAVVLKFDNKADTCYCSGEGGVGGEQ